MAARASAGPTPLRPRARPSPEGTLSTVRATAPDLSSGRGRRSRTHRIAASMRLWWKSEMRTCTSTLRCTHGCHHRRLSRLRARSPCTTIRTLQALPTVSQGAKSHRRSSSGTPLECRREAMRELSNRMWESSPLGWGAFIDPALVQKTAQRTPVALQDRYNSSAASDRLTVQGGTPLSSGEPGPPPGTTMSFFTAYRGARIRHAVSLAPCLTSKLV
mmetsp:Transcript_11088/g.26307  ORF Transcript_11088/g.26307 Transcript_11088/m.26307 type:complete len:217 (-) Transcript_11088:575-1225(-)